MMHQSRDSAGPVEARDGGGGGRRRSLACAPSGQGEVGELMNTYDSRQEKLRSLNCLTERVRDERKENGALGNEDP